MSLHDVDDWEARVQVQTGGGEQCRAYVAGEQRVAAAAVRHRDPLCLSERVDCEPARALKPELILRACECLEEREAVAGGSVTEAVALLVAMRAGSPDQIGRRQQQPLIEVVPRPRDDPRSAGAPLEANPTVPRPRERPTGCSWPIGEAAVADCMSGKHGRGLASKCFVGLE